LEDILRDLYKISQNEIKNLENISKDIRCSILTMVKEAEVGYIGGSLSVTEILVALYFKILRIDPKNPFWEDRVTDLYFQKVMVLQRYILLLRLKVFSQKIS